MTMTRHHTITADELARLHPHLVPVVVRAGAGGYAVVVSILNTVRWLAADRGPHLVFADLDAVAQILARTGVRRFAVDLTGANL